MLTSFSRIQRKKQTDLKLPLYNFPLSIPPFAYSPLVCRGHLLGGLDSDIWVPFSRGKDDYLIQELVNPGDQIIPIAGFIGHVAEELAAKRKIKSGLWPRSPCYPPPGTTPHTVSKKIAWNHCSCCQCALCFSDENISQQVKYGPPGKQQPWGHMAPLESEGQVSMFQLSDFA